MTRRGWIGSITLLLVVFATAGCLAAWKRAAIAESDAAAANQPEPMESITTALAKAHEYRPMTTAIGTVRALQSVSLRNEVAGTVNEIHLTPGAIVEKGALLVALDVSVETAELNAQRARAALAKTLLDRFEGARRNRAVSDMEVDRAQAEYDVAQAEMARIEAIIDRKTIEAPFRARVGLSDVHQGQYLEEGTLLTTLQGVDEMLHIDFTVAQHVAAELDESELIEVLTADHRTNEPVAVTAEIVATDARINPITRNAVVRAKVKSSSIPFAPGASVRVRAPVGPLKRGVLIPVSAVRKGPGGDRVFVIVADDQGHNRAESRFVECGAAFGDEVVIHSGVDAGEMVATSGSFKLRDGVLVAIASENPALTSARN